MKTNIVGRLLVAGALVVSPLVISAGPAHAQRATTPVALQPAPAGAEALRAKLVAALRADARSKLPVATSPFLGKMKTKDAAFAPEAAARDALVLGGYLGYTTRAATDIEALVFVLMLEASKAAEEELRAVMEEVNEINRHKRAVRDAIAQCKRDRACLKDAKPPASLTKAAFDKLVGLELDGGAEMQELRMQLLMDRRSSMLQTLSNLMKKLSDTAAGIIQNMK